MRTLIPRVQISWIFPAGILADINCAASDCFWTCSLGRGEPNGEYKAEKSKCPTDINCRWFLNRRDIIFGNLSGCTLMLSVLNLPLRFLTCKLKWLFLFILSSGSWFGKLGTEWRYLCFIRWAVAFVWLSSTHGCTNEQVGSRWKQAQAHRSDELQTSADTPFTRRVCMRNKNILRIICTQGTNRSSIYQAQCYCVNMLPLWTRYSLKLWKHLRSMWKLKYPPCPLSNCIWSKLWVSPTK